MVAMANSTSIVLSSLLFIIFLVPSVRSRLQDAPAPSLPPVPAPAAAPAAAPVPAAAPATAPVPAPADSISLMEELRKSNYPYNMLISLLNATGVGLKANEILKNSSEGLTVFAPTDNAFTNLKPGALNTLNAQQQAQLLLYHVLPKYYPMKELSAVSNPATTLASGKDSKSFVLNIIGQANNVDVSTGLVQTHVNDAIKRPFPLAIYVLEAVLLPPDLFAAKPPAPTPSPSDPPSPPPPSPSDPPSANAPSSDAPSSDVEPPPADQPGDQPEDQNSGSGGNGTGLALVLTLAWLCFVILS